MGRKEKNEKKTERINALRKKYESFLEEDRKRKERNEYILGQLDKMRTCNSIVPANKLKPVETNLTKLPVEVDLQRRYLRPREYDVELAVPLLKKITENYILIPKLRRPLENTEEIPQLRKASVDDPDWQTKYEILNILKKAEKGEPVAEIKNVTRQPSQQFTKPLHSFDVPERDNLCEEIIVPPITKSTRNFKAYPVKLRKDSQDDDNTVTTVESVITNEIGHKINEVHIKSNEKLEYDDENGLNPAHIYYPREDIGKPLGDIPRETEDQYPIEIINVEEFTPHDSVILKDGENINPKIIETMEKPSGQDQLNIKVNQEVPLKHRNNFENESKHIPTEPYTKKAISDDDVTSSNIKGDIQEFEREQEQFYQPAIAKPKNTIEPVQHSFDVMPENIKENEQYSYTGPHENPESVFISEHEETSSAYDQSYAQQYMTAELQDNQTLDGVATTTNNQVEVSAGSYEGHPTVYEGQDTYEDQEALAAYAGQEISEGHGHPTAYEGQEGYAGQEVPADYGGQESYANQEEVSASHVGQDTYEGQAYTAAYTGQEVPAAYVGQGAYEDQEHPATYGGQEAYTGQEIPAGYVGQEAYEGQEIQAGYGGQEAYTGQEVPEAYTSQDTYQGQEQPAAYEGQDVYPRQEVPAAYTGQETYEGQEIPAAYEGQGAYTGQEIPADYLVQKTYERQEHPAAYEGHEAYPGQEVPSAYAGQETYEGQEIPAAYEGQEAFTGQEIPAANEGLEIPAENTGRGTYDDQQEINSDAFKGREEGQKYPPAPQKAFEGQQGYEGEVYAQLQSDVAAPYNEPTQDVQGLQYKQEYPAAKSFGDGAT